MTAEPYTADELPGVIAEWKNFIALRRNVGARVTAKKFAELERLLATVEAMAADSEIARCAVAYVEIKSKAPQVAGEAYRDLCEAIDAARKGTP